MNISTTLKRRPVVRYLAAVALCAAGGGVGAAMAVTFGSPSPVGVLITAAGGVFAMLVVAASSVLALRPDPVDILLTGGLACALFQIIGYALAWAGWWLARR